MSKQILIEAAILLVIIIGSFSLGCLYQYGRDTIHYEVDNEICRASGLDLDDESRLGGFFRSDNLICYRADYQWYRTNEFKNHEECHAFVKHDYVHFCEEALR